MTKKCRMKKSARYYLERRYENNILCVEKEEERTGYSIFELERMSRSERIRVIEKAGLDPSDYSGLF